MSSIEHLLEDSRRHCGPQCSELEAARLDQVAGARLNCMAPPLTQALLTYHNTPPRCCIPSRIEQPGPGGQPGCQAGSPSLVERCRTVLPSLRRATVADATWLLNPA